MRRREFCQKLTTSTLGLGILGGKSPSFVAAQSQGYEHISEERLQGQLRAQWIWRKSRIQSPHPLTNGWHLFTDWRYVDVADLTWAAEDGAPIKMLDSGPPVTEAYAVHGDMPRGVKIAAQPATMGDLIDGVGGGTLIYDRGRYRLWNTVHRNAAWHLPGLPDEKRHQLNKEWEPYVVYAESDNGTQWHIPKFDHVDAGPYAGPNVVFGGKTTYETGLHQPTVFVDPSAQPSERYKMIYGGRVGKDLGFGAHGSGDPEEVRRVLDHFRKTRPNDIGAGSLMGLPTYIECMYGATSPDGLHWKPNPKPLLFHSSDTANRAYFDTTLNKYVWYGRLTWYGRRVVGRAESDDFKSFTTPEIVLRPGPQNAPYVDWYTNAKTIYPGSTDEHLMLPGLYNRLDQSSSVYLFSSPDGIHWDEVPEGPVLEGAPEGNPDDTFVLASGDLVPLPQDRVGVMCSANLLPHKYPRRAGGSTGLGFWAWWPKGRLAAIEAEEFGSFTTPPLKLSGRKLMLNVQTKMTGEVKVEVARPEAAAIEDRDFRSCDPIVGDDLERTVTWQGQSDVGHKLDETVVFRFRMRMAQLFSFRVV